jgi:hypothetical protein
LPTSPEQGREPGLLEMAIAGQRLGHTALLHDR